MKKRLLFLTFFLLTLIIDVKIVDATNNINKPIINIIPAIDKNTFVNHNYPVYFNVLEDVDIKEIRYEVSYVRGGVYKGIIYEKTNDDILKNYFGVIPHNTGYNNDVYIKVFVTDIDGNKSDLSYYISNIDRIAPQIFQLTKTLSENKQSLKISGLVHDLYTDAPINKIIIAYGDYTINSFDKNLIPTDNIIYNPSKVSFYNHYFSVDVYENGYYSIFVSDTAGNKDVINYYIENIHDDEIAPSVEIVKNIPNKLNTYSIDLNIISEDDSGIKNIKYKEKNDSNYIVLNKEKVNKVTLDKNGIYSFEVTDNKNNTTIKEITINEIITEPFIKEPLLSNYFSNIEWIERDGIISLSLTPKKDGPLIGSLFGQNDFKILPEVHPAFDMLKKTLEQDYLWNNQTQSIYNQYICHIVGAGSEKTPWNLEPQRKTLSGFSTLLYKCNIEIDKTIPNINHDTFIYKNTSYIVDFYK